MIGLWLRKLIKAPEDTCDNRMQVEKQACDFSGVYAEYIHNWLKAGVVMSNIPSGTILYSGQFNQQLEDFDHNYNAKQYGLGMWLSEGLSYAKDYCYFRANEETKGRIVFKLQAKNDVPVLEFPPGYHPADEINRILDGLAPDAFLSKHWEGIFATLVRHDAYFAGAKGHIRKQDGCAMDSLGVAHNGLVEVWLKEPSEFVALSATKVPATKDEFFDLYGKNAEEIPSLFYGL